MTILRYENEVPERITSSFVTSHPHVLGAQGLSPGPPMTGGKRRVPYWHTTSIGLSDYVENIPRIALPLRDEV